MRVFEFGSSPINGIWPKFFARRPTSSLDRMLKLTPWKNHGYEVVQGQATASNLLPQHPFSSTL